VKETALVQTLLALSETLATERTLGFALAEIIEMTTTSIPGCDAASVALSIEGRPATAAINARVALEADLAQYDTDEGACLEALRTAHTLRLDLVESTDAFPHFASEANRLGIKSFLSVPAHWGDLVVGTLNIYSRRTDGFDETGEAIARVLASRVAVAISRSPEYRAARDAVEQAQRDADDHADIALATGLLMGNEDCTIQQAEALLQNAATRRDQPILETAQSIIRAAR
jgi:GAF domain-containing protein